MKLIPNSYAIQPRTAPRGSSGVGFGKISKLPKLPKEPIKTMKSCVFTKFREGKKDNFWGKLVGSCEFRDDNNRLLIADVYLSDAVRRGYDNPDITGGTTLVHTQNKTMTFIAKDEKLFYAEIMQPHVSTGKPIELAQYGIVSDKICGFVEMSDILGVCQKILMKNNTP